LAVEIMTQISKVDLIVQQLENLSLAELQEIKSKVDDLIENKSGTKDIESLELESRKRGVLPATSYRGWTRLVTGDQSPITPVSDGYVISIPGGGAIIEFYLYSTTSQNKKSSVPDFCIAWRSYETSDIKIDDAPVKNIIDLVNDWMCDESGYDEETYPQIEAALNQSQ